MIVVEWFLWGMVVVVLGLASLVAAGRYGGMPATAVHDTAVPELPDRPLTGADVRQVRFAVTPRGYSMAQVDDLLHRLAVQLGEPPLQGVEPPVAAPAKPDASGSEADPEANSRSAPSDSSQSAIMEQNVSWQPGNEGEHGSNEAPHG